jgi:hypothetical protein
MIRLRSPAITLPSCRACGSFLLKVTNPTAVRAVLGHLVSGDENDAPQISPRLSREPRSAPQEWETWDAMRRRIESAGSGQETTGQILTEMINGQPVTVPKTHL